MSPHLGVDKPTLKKAAQFRRKEAVFIETLQENMALLEQIMDMMANHFGDRCEVVLHDLTKSYANTIVAIRNGHISGRKVGGSGSNLGLEVLRGSVHEDEQNKYRYMTQTKEGKVLSSSSTYFKDEAGKVIGALCVNFDISDFLMAENVLRSLTNGYMNQEVKEVLVQDTQELFNYLLEQAQQDVGKPVSHMSREDKLAFIKFMDEHGAFLIKKAGDKVCEYLDISKYLLYSVLNESRDDTKQELL